MHDTRPIDKSSKYGFLEGWVSIVVNLLLFVLKYYAGVMTGSVAIIADAWHTLSDSLTSVVVLVGFKISKKPADDDHPFGHGRAELIASFVIGVLLAVVAFEFLVQSIEKLIDRGTTNYGTFAVVATVISIIAKEALARFAFWAGKKADSKAIMADAWHHRSDALSSIIILVGIFLGGWFWWIDGVLGIIVALMISYASFEILKDTIDILLGTKPNKKLRKEIIALADSVTDVDLKIHHIHLHKYGHHSELTFHIFLPGNMTLEESHEIATALEELILDKLSMISTIHMEPYE